MSRALRLAIVEQRQLHLFHVQETQIKIPRSYRANLIDKNMQKLFALMGVCITAMLFHELAIYAGHLMAGVK